MERGETGSVGSVTERQDIMVDDFVMEKGVVKQASSPPLKTSSSTKMKSSSSSSTSASSAVCPFLGNTSTYSGSASNRHSARDPSVLQEDDKKPNTERNVTEEHFSTDGDGPRDPSVIVAGYHVPKEQTGTQVPRRGQLEP